uniref:Uncharacterized protein n=1 Tax=Moniliophthora roreri TaxID=221103 RepID=A0A0W0FFN0_MONRR
MNLLEQRQYMVDMISQTILHHALVLATKISS